jgi:hypothetical protein
MIQIFTTVVNRPDFLTIQNKLFNKFLLDEFSFHVVDDSIDPAISNEYKSICEQEGNHYYKKPKLGDPNDPAMACAQAIQWTYDNLIRTDHNQDIVFVCDSDLFLVDEFSIEEFMSDCEIAALPQQRGHVEYIWNGIMFFNLPRLKSLDINFSCGLVEGQLTDVGGFTYYYLKENQPNFKRTDVIYPTHFNEIELQNEDVTKGYNFELHLDQKFLHYRAATNWHSNWRSNNDPLTKKTEIFNQVINSIINS